VTTIDPIFAQPALSALHFDNAFVRELPGDDEAGPRRRQVHGALYSRVDPEPVVAPRLIAYSPEVATLLGITAADVASPEFVRIFSGNAVVDGMQPYAANYGGHQFGNWAGQLGDGRAITLGETINAAGERGKLQLKGQDRRPMPAPLTAARYCVRRFANFSAARRCIIWACRRRVRAMPGRDGEQVERDMSYDGHPRDEPGAIVCRVAPSFIRFGNFELPASPATCPC
jgi:uncharacterized protein YdiU (UPF0061 family)